MDMNDLNIIRSGFYKKRHFHLQNKKLMGACTLWCENDGHGMQERLQVTGEKVLKFNCGIT